MRPDDRRDYTVSFRVTRRTFWQLDAIRREFGLPQGTLAYWLVEAKLAEIVGVGTEEKQHRMEEYLPSDLCEKFHMAVDKAAARAARDGVPW